MDPRVRYASHHTIVAAPSQRTEERFRSADGSDSPRAVLLSRKSLSFWQGIPRRAMPRRDGPPGRLYKSSRLREIPILRIGCSVILSSQSQSKKERGLPMKVFGKSLSEYVAFQK